MSTKDEYVRKMHSRLDRWSAEIDALAAKANVAEAKTRARYHEQVEGLRSKRDDAKVKLEKLQHSSEGAWEDLKAGVELAWDAMRDAMSEAVESAKSRFER